MNGCGDSLCLSRRGETTRARRSAPPPAPAGTTSSTCCVGCQPAAAASRVCMGARPPRIPTANATIPRCFIVPPFPALGQAAPLEPDSGAVPARIGPAPQEAGDRIDEDGLRVPHGVRPVLQAPHLVAAPRQVLRHGGREAPLDLERPRILAPRAPVEPAGRLDGLLHVHAEVHY